MKTEKCESLLSQWFRRVWNEEDVSAIEELASPDFASHGVAGTIVGEATGEPTTMYGMCLFRIADGKVAEGWDTWDFIGLLESMKLLPSGSFGRAIAGALERHPRA